MGKASRDKGARSERALRDELIRHGWSDVRRVPLSGAVKTSIAYQDDVVGTAPNGKEYRFENKARATGFDAYYRLLPRETSVHSVALESGACFTIALDPNVCIAPATFLSVSEFEVAYQKAFHSIEKKCRNWIGNAEILSLKQDRKPFLYVRWFK